jgi:hydroxymethylpyrimidine/phosphomethylpyrimidine kinase
MTPERLQRAVLTITGSDSCGGAGIQADIKTFKAMGVHGATVVTAVSAQNSKGFRAMEKVPDGLILDQLEAVLEDLPIRAIKTGTLPSVVTIGILGEKLAELSPRVPLVVDPVLLSTSGAKLAATTAIEAMRDHLFPLAKLITPDLEEAELLTELKISTVPEMEIAAKSLLSFGSDAVLLKGGHLEGKELTDILVSHRSKRTFTHPAAEGLYHGTGSTLSAAIAAGLALGKGLESSVETAIEYVQACLRSSRIPVKGNIRLLGHHRADW